MKCMIIMLIAMIGGAAIGEYVDDKILYPVLIGLLIFFSLIKLYLNQQGENNSNTS